MTITALIDRLEQLEGPDREADAAIAVTLPGAKHADVLSCAGCRCAPRFTESIDAALTLVPEGLEWHVAGPNKRHGNGQAWAGVFGEPFVGSENDSFAATPAIAICIAALRAQAMEDR